MFINFNRAFDSIHGGKMLKILIAYGIPEAIVAAVGLLHTGAKAKVLSADGETEFLEILAGVLQGDTLVPYIFTIILDCAVRQATRNDAQKIGFKLDHKRSRTQSRYNYRSGLCWWHSTVYRANGTNTKPLIPFLT